MNRIEFVALSYIAKKNGALPGTAKVITQFRMGMITFSFTFLILFPLPSYFPAAAGGSETRPMNKIELVGL